MGSACVEISHVSDPDDDQETGIYDPKFQAEQREKRAKRFRAYFEEQNPA